MIKRLALALLLSFALMSGCTQQTATAPPVPAELAHLPAAAITIGCPGELRPPGNIQAFELPGLTPEDNSAGNSNTGRNLFILPYCEKVDVIDYAWSEMDGRYYLRIRLKDGSEGWMYQTFITLR